MSQTQLTEPHHPRPQWRSRAGFILAALGSAVGLGNIWRFSYLCYKNGGGAFLIPYVIALFTVGIPLLILEMGLGHKTRGCAPLAFAKISRRWEWCGWWAVTCAMYGIMLYYAAVIAWCICYTFFAFDLSWGADPNDFFFHQFLQVSGGPFEFGQIQANIILALIVVWGLCWVIVNFGVQKGLERANKVFMPLLFGLILVLVVWSVNLEGAIEGLKVYLSPDFSQLSRPHIWIDAFSQIFFTMSLAFGIMITYASYLPRKADLITDALVISLGDCAFSFIAGFAVFGTLGYMATSMGVPVAEVVKESIGLAFVAYPQAISLVPAFAKAFGVLFFFSLVIAGITSAISLVEAFSSAIIDKFGYSRSAVVAVVCITGFLGSIIFAAQSGLYWVDIVDHFITHYGLVVVGLIECLLVGWVLGATKLREHISNAAQVKLHSFWDICIKVITPVVLTILLINDLIKEFSAPYGDYSWLSIVLIGRDWLLLALMASFILSMRPWQKEANVKD